MHPLISRDLARVLLAEREQDLRRRTQAPRPHGPTMRSRVAAGLRRRAR